MDGEGLSSEPNIFVVFQQRTNALTTSHVLLLRRRSDELLLHRWSLLLTIRSRPHRRNDFLHRDTDPINGGGKIAYDRNTSRVPNFGICFEVPSTVNFKLCWCHAMQVISPRWSIRAYFYHRLRVTRAIRLPSRRWIHRFPGASRLYLPSNLPQGQSRSSSKPSPQPQMQNRSTSERWGGWS